MKLNRLVIDNFKGITHKELTFNDETFISGRNGKGKTTIATAWFWLMGNVDIDLKNNPDIYPLGAEEATPSVTAELEIEGKKVLISKEQTRKVSKPDMNGVCRVSLTNNYSINAVPKSERDFKADLTDRGLDFDLFLPLSHVDMFVGEKKDEQRKVLFNMVSNLSDIEMAENIKDEIPNLFELLENYKTDEISAMQRATLSKINEEYGKSGEILKSKIEGLELSKEHFELAEIELERTGLERELKANLAEQAESDKAFEVYDKLANKIFQLKFDLNDLCRKANEENENRRSELNREMTETGNVVRNLHHNIEAIKNDIAGAERTVEEAARQLEKCREEYKSVSEEQLNPESMNCPTCGQKLPEEKIEKIFADFDATKKRRLDRIVEAGNIAKANKTKAEAEIPNLKDFVAKCEADLEEHETKLAKLTAEYADTDEYVNVLASPFAEQYKRTKEELEIAEADSKNLSLPSDTKSKLRIQESEIRARISQNEGRLLFIEHNNKVDRQIAELRAKQLEYEQARADAQNILYQLDKLTEYKNAILENEINSHFGIVRFKLFDHLKNGNYVNTCLAMVDGKELNASCNTGLQILAKIDIVSGLQKFYKQSYPIFVDGAESLDSISKSKVNTEAQTIMLCVSEDNELNIK